MLWRDIEQIRATAPLVHNITNYVVMNSTANALLALGASPVMAHAVDEVADMAALAGALVLNIGTLSTPWIDAMLRAGEVARARRIPIIVDPVGSGATPFRTATALRLLHDVSPTIVRGNASEIASLVGDSTSTKGVDSSMGVDAVEQMARFLASSTNCAVAVSGAVDLIVDATTTIRVANGHPMMTRVTGLGCTATALTGAFAAVNPSAVHAAAHALAVTGLAGEIAAERSPGPGTLQLQFIDALFALDQATVERRLKMTVQ